MKVTSGYWQSASKTYGDQYGLDGSYPIPVTMYGECGGQIVFNPQRYSGAAQKYASVAKLLEKYQWRAPCARGASARRDGTPKMHRPRARRRCTP